MAQSKPKPKLEISFEVPRKPAALRAGAGAGASAGADDLVSGPQTQLHSFWGNPFGSYDTEIKTWPVDELREHWASRMQAIQDLLVDGIVKQVSGWTVEEVEIGLGVSGEGQLLFLAKAGANASIKLKLKRAK